MSNIDYTQWNTRERAVSSDLNRATKLFHRALEEAVAFMTSGAAKATGCFGDSFIATPVAGTMKTAIGPGLALFADATQLYPESAAVWVESREIREITHDVGGANPRYDVIEMRPGTQISVTQGRDVFDPITGAFSIQNVTKEVKCYPEFRITKGAEAFSPSLPAGSAGWIPLSYVLVPAGAVSLLATNVVYCRPLLAPMHAASGFVTPAPARFATRVTGGGLNCAGGSLTATIATSVRGRFEGAYHDFRIDAGCEAKITVFTYDGGGLPAADKAIYFYAIPPLYPSGYSAELAARELWSPALTTMYSGQAGFLSTTLQDGCLIVASDTAPDATHPAGPASGTGSFSNLFFAAGASSSSRQTWVYLGAASFENVGGTLIEQSTIGRATATKRKPGKSFFADLPIAVNTQYVMWTELSGDPTVRWPSTAREVELHLRAAINAAGNLVFAAFDAVGDDSNNRGMVTIVCANNNVAQQNCGYNWKAYLDTSGRVTIKSSSHSGAASAIMVAKDYRDAVLLLR